MNRIEQILTFLKDTPLDPFLNYALALEYLKLEQFKEAEDLFISLIKNSPNYVPTYYHYGKLLETQQKNELALTIYKEGIIKAKLSGEQHQLSELQTAFVNLEMLDLL